MYKTGLLILDRVFGSGDSSFEYMTNIQGLPKNETAMFQIFYTGNY